MCVRRLCKYTTGLVCVFANLNAHKLTDTSHVGLAVEQDFYSIYKNAIKTYTGT